MELHWPQITIIVLVLLSTVSTAIMHKEPRTGQYNVLSTMIADGLMVWILYCGGFFS